MINKADNDRVLQTFRTASDLGRFVQFVQYERSVFFEFS